MDIELTSELTVDSLKELLENSLLKHRVKDTHIYNAEAAELLRCLRENVEERDGISIIIKDNMMNVCARISYTNSLAVDYEKYGDFCCAKIWIHSDHFSTKIQLHPCVLGRRFSDTLHWKR